MVAIRSRARRCYVKQSFTKAELIVGWIQYEPFCGHEMLEGSNGSDIKWLCVEDLCTRYWNENESADATSSFAFTRHGWRYAWANSKEETTSQTSSSSHYDLLHTSGQQVVSTYASREALPVRSRMDRSSISAAESFSYCREETKRLYNNRNVATTGSAENSKRTTRIEL